jgi:hypothetical protein
MPETNQRSDADACNQPKWAALVDDEVIPMPQQKVKARVIRAQASVTNGLLVRDHNSPADVILRDGKM